MELRASIFVFQMLLFSRHSCNCLKKDYFIEVNFIAFVRDHIPSDIRSRNSN